MAKRKGSAAESNTNKKMKKEVAKNGIVNGKKDKVDSTTKLDFSSGENVIKSLLGNTDLSKFFDQFWEKKHLLVKRKQTEYYGELFSFAAFKEMLKEQELEFESDVNVCRYLNNEKELLNEDGTLTVEKCEELWKGKNATFQLHQPQRYSEILWKLMEKMETYFGCLVGSNVYMTPKGSQGLAPHCDDIEVFILQLEGSKKWKLYKPMVELSRDYTLDLPQDSIGEPFIETILEPGDMLYFPRGTIHQAETVGDSHSTHITLSTYQHNTLGDFLNTAVTQAIENALENDVSFRRGLPLNYFSYLGTQTNFGKYVEESDEKKTLSSNENDVRVKNFKENIKAHLSMLIDHIDVDVAADSMSQDFVASRLPPFGHVVKEEEDSTASPPELESKVKLRYPQHVRVMYIDCEEEEEEDEDETIEEDEDEEEEEPEEKPAKSAKKKRESLPEEDEEDADADLEDDGPCIKLMHSLNNDKQTHMSNTPVLDDMVSLKFPVHYAQALTHLMQAKGEFVSVKDLPLEEDDEKLQFAVSLFSDDLIEIKS